MGTAPFYYLFVCVLQRFLICSCVVGWGGRDCIDTRRRFVHIRNVNRSFKQARDAFIASHSNVKLPCDPIGKSAQSKALRRRLVQQSIKQRTQKKINREGCKYGFFIFKAQEKKRYAAAHSWRKREYFGGNPELEAQISEAWQQLGDAGQETYRGLARTENRANRDPQKNANRRKQLARQRAELSMKAPKKDRPKPLSSFHTPWGIGDDSNPVSAAAMIEAKHAGLDKSTCEVLSKAMHQPVL